MVPVTFEVRNTGAGGSTIAAALALQQGQRQPHGGAGADAGAGAARASDWMMGQLRRYLRQVEFARMWAQVRHTGRPDISASSNRTASSTSSTTTTTTIDAHNNPDNVFASSGLASGGFLRSAIAIARGEAAPDL